MACMGLACCGAPARCVTGWQRLCPRHGATQRGCALRELRIQSRRLSSCRLAPLPRTGFALHTLAHTATGIHGCLAARFSCHIPRTPRLPVRLHASSLTQVLPFVTAPKQRFVRQRWQLAPGQGLVAVAGRSAHASFAPLVQVSHRACVGGQLAPAQQFVAMFVGGPMGRQGAQAWGLWVGGEAQQRPGSVVPAAPRALRRLWWRLAASSAVRVWCCCLLRGRRWWRRRQRRRAWRASGSRWRTSPSLAFR